MNVVEDCKKYLGLPPYNGWTNIVVSDFYFYKSICKKYGEDVVDKMIKMLKENFKE